MPQYLNQDLDFDEVRWATMRKTSYDSRRSFQGSPEKVLREPESQRAIRFRPKSRYTALNDTTGHEKTMGSPAASPITGLLIRWSAGEQGCLDELLPLVERGLRCIAHRHMRKEREGHTLQTTALVNEAHEADDAG